MKMFKKFSLFTKTKEDATEDYIYSSVKKLERIANEYMQNLEGIKEGADKCMVRLKKTDSKITKCKREIEILVEKINETVNDTVNDTNKDVLLKYVEKKEILEENLMDLEKVYNIEKSAVDKLENRCFILVKKINEVKRNRNCLLSKYDSMRLLGKSMGFINSSDKRETYSNFQKRSYEVARNAVFE